MDQASACTNDRMMPKRAMVPKRERALAAPSFALLWLRVATLFCLAILVGTSVGCSEGVERVKVSGQVLIDGEPVRAGFIRVYPVGVRDSSSNLDSEGRFDLRSYKPGDGIPLGSHVVTINGSEMLNLNQRKWHTPPKYSRISTSGLKLEVTGTTEEAVIELTWGGGKPFIQKMTDFEE